MKLYRLSSQTHANDLSGEGSRLFGGRWNNKGTPCVYTSFARSLCVCEYAVHVSLTNLPKKLAMITYQVPKTSMLTLEVDDLPADWDDNPAPFSTKDLGTELLTQNEHLLIAVPSAVIHDEYNYIINPRHADIQKIKIERIALFTFDPRLKT